jgi:hypothetical protein
MDEGHATSLRSGVVRFSEARARIPTPSGERAVLALKRGTLDVKLSIPVPPNEQAPHAQDEIYAVIRGRGVLVHAGRRDPFEAGDAVRRVRRAASLRGFSGDRAGGSSTAARWRDSQR